MVSNDEKKKRRRKGALSGSLERKCISRCAFRAPFAELQMLQQMQHVRKRAS